MESRQRVCKRGLDAISAPSTKSNSCLQAKRDPEGYRTTELYMKLQKGVEIVRERLRKQKEAGGHAVPSRPVHA
jgi:hypothetical protein